MEVAIWLAMVAAVYVAAIGLSLYKRDRIGVVLAWVITGVAVIFAVGIVRFDDAIGSSDCVGVCISEFAYDSAWIMALGGGLLFLILLGIALARAVQQARRPK